MSSGFAAIGLHRAKDRNNIGSVLRAAMCYSASMVAVSGRRYAHSKTDTTKAFRSLPLIACEDLRQVIPHGAVPIAVDLINGAQQLPAFKHPRNAFYVFGPEDGTLGGETLTWCRDVVYVPTRFCMNLAAAVNVVLYDRLAKGGAA